MLCAEIFGLVQRSFLKIIVVLTILIVSVFIVKYIINIRPSVKTSIVGSWQFEEDNLILQISFHTDGKYDQAFVKNVKKGGKKEDSRIRRRGEKSIPFIPQKKSNPEWKNVSGVWNIINENTLSMSENDGDVQVFSIIGFGDDGRLFLSPKTDKAKVSILFPIKKESK